jgi:hypothetical protein
VSFILRFTIIHVLECPDALDRRALFDARTKIAEQEKEIKSLRQSIPSKELVRNYQELQQKMSTLIDPEMLAEKDRQIASLQAEIERIRQEKEVEVELLRAVASGVVEEAEAELEQEK